MMLSCEVKIEEELDTSHICQHMSAVHCHPELAYPAPQCSAKDVSSWMPIHLPWQNRAGTRVDRIHRLVPWYFGSFQLEHGIPRWRFPYMGVPP